MRFPLAAMFFAVLLFVAMVGYVATSVMLDYTEEELTKTEMLDNMLPADAVRFQDNIATLKLGFGVSMIILFIFIVIAFFVDALRSEPEDFYPRRRQ